MFAPQKHYVDPDAEGDTLIIPRERKLCLPRSGRSLTARPGAWHRDMSLSARLVPVTGHVLVGQGSEMGPPGFEPGTNGL